MSVKAMLYIGSGKKWTTVSLTISDVYRYHNSELSPFKDSINMSVKAMLYNFRPAEVLNIQRLSA